MKVVVNNQKYYLKFVELRQRNAPIGWITTASKLCPMQGAGEGFGSP
jgi:hypothetical protein